MCLEGKALPRASVSHLKIEVVGLAIAFPIFLFSYRTFCSIETYGLRKHRIKERDEQASSSALDGGGVLLNV